MTKHNLNLNIIDDLDENHLDENHLDEHHLENTITENILDETSQSSSSSSVTLLENPSKIKYATKKQRYSLEETLRKMRKYRWLHKSAAEYFDKLNSYIMTPTILFSAVTTVLTVANTNPLLLASIAGVSTTLVGLSTYLKLGSKHMNHLVAAEGYDNLVTQIDFEIKFPDQDIKQFASSLEKKILEIKKSSHYLPPEFIYKKYLKKKLVVEGYGNHNV